MKEKKISYNTRIFCRKNPNKKIEIFFLNIFVVPLPDTPVGDLATSYFSKKILKIWQRCNFKKKKMLSQLDQILLIFRGSVVGDETACNERYVVIRVNPRDFQVALRLYNSAPYTISDR